MPRLGWSPPRAHPRLWPGHLLLAALATLPSPWGCAHAPPPPALPPTRAETHLREPFRRPLTGSAVMLPVLECTSEGVERVPNLDARAGSVMLADELWRRLGLPGEPEPDEAGRLAEHDKLCKQLADNRAAGNNVDSASPQMRELLRDFFRRYSAQSWLVVATKWLQLGETVPGSATGRGVGALDGRRYETDILEASLYVWSRDGDVVFRADLSCRGQNKGEEHDCGPRFEKIPARVGEMVDGFPLPIIAKAVIIRVTPDLPSRREPPLPDYTDADLKSLQTYQAATARLQALRTPSPAASSDDNMGRGGNNIETFSRVV